MVSVGSAAGAICVPNTAAYSASKAALAQLTRVLAKEYADAPIRINMVAPGAIAVGLPPPEEAQGVDARAVQRTLAGRGLIPVEELADLVVFLVSDAAQGFHGACLPLDKGMSLG
jgi:NAD(P)-dependent dehydrogenase (short-subunit alcohol dehydrogenase family)